MEQIELAWEPARRTWTVAELSARIRGLLSGELGDVWVSGEISGVRVAASGHCYFTLKDREAQLPCVCFRQTLRYLKCRPKDGLAVLARGGIDVYEARGQYQLIVEALEPEGLGALQLAFEKLKEKLAAEGLFDAARKRPLPKFPRRVGIVTSPTGAVIQDMLNVFERRFPGIHIRVYPALVQGEGAAEAVCAGLRYFAESGWCEVAIVARGGGSLEDLWAFNEEAVARAIAASPVPVISAIGHETDFTIADFVADLRAPTPSAAAELATGTLASVLERFAALEGKMGQGLRYKLAVSGRRLHELGIGRTAATLRRTLGRRQQRADELDSALRERMRAAAIEQRRRWERAAARLAALDLRLRFAKFLRRLAAAEAGAEQCVRLRLGRARAALDTRAAHLSQLSPLKILDRGYAIVQNEAGAVVREPEAAPAGSAIAIRLARGSLRAKVERERPRGASKKK